MATRVQVGPEGRTTRVVPPGELLEELVSRSAKPAPRGGGGRPARSRRRMRRLGLMTLVFPFLLSLAGAGLVLGVHDEEFQLEGNALASDETFTDIDDINPGNPVTTVLTPGALTGVFAGDFDWSSLVNVSADGTPTAKTSGLPGSFTDVEFKVDFQFTGTTFLNDDSTTFATGSKDTLDITPGWQCNQDNNVNSKTDIVNGYAALWDDGTDRILYFGLEKDVDNGTNNVGVWLFQDPEVGCESPGGNTAFTGNHVAGDLFLVSAFTRGGGVANITAYQWTDDLDGDGTADDPGLDPDPVDNLVNGDCLDSNGSDRLCAVVNGKNITMPWRSADSSVIDAPKVSPNFFEGGINLSEFPEFADTCFTGFMLETRSSQSLTATLFDYALGEIDFCNPDIDVTKSARTSDICDGSSTSVTYDFTVSNPGNVTITDITVTDDVLGSLTAAFVAANGGSDDLAPGGSVSFTASGSLSGTTTNTVTAAGSTTAGAVSATASDTVTGHVCTISVTKVADDTDICTGGSTSYTIVVTNDSDQFSWTGSVIDDVLGTLAASVTLAPGASATYTPSSGALSVDTTNTVTASGAFDDPASTSASANASATVDVHVCTISVTKVADDTDICVGGSTSYTIVVTNDSDQFSWTGSVIDDVLGTLAASVTLAPGASATYTPSSGALSVDTTNTVTASGAFDDPASTSASANASATVDVHVCTISVTKVADDTDICVGGSTSYTIVVTNDSDQFSWTGSVIDDVLGTLAASVTLAPGASATYTPSSGALSVDTTNTVTASGAFDDPASTSASANASATVTVHACTISLTKSPSVTDVCNGSSTSVTYTYVVTNDSDFNASGTITDDKLGSIGSFGPLAPGASATLTKVGTVNATVTNLATANATFDDPASTTASATASATVTGHVCTISITKVADDTEICTGGSTSYTIVVTNDSPQFSWTGSVVDDVLGTLDASLTLAPGASATYTPSSGALSVDTTNTVTASGAFDDPASTTASANASATVNVNVCTISVTKRADADSVCQGESTTYDFTVTNNSGQFSWTGSVIDDVVGTIDASVTIAPGQTVSYNNVAGPALTQDTTNTVTASGAFNDPAGTSASATASDTVTVESCGGNIFHTGTTCQQYVGTEPPSGLAGTDLTQVNYSVKANKISQIDPGVFFYYTTVESSGSSVTAFINQIPPASFPNPMAVHNDEVRVFDADCNVYSNFTISIANGDVTVVINGTSAGDVFHISVKYNPKSLVGLTKPSTDPVKYNFETQVGGVVVDGDDDGLDLKRK